MVKKITGNAGEVFGIKSNDETRYLLRADIWSYYFLGVYWVYRKKSMKKPGRMRRIGYIERNCMKEPNGMRNIGYIRRKLLKKPN